MKTLREKIVYTSEQSKNNDYKEVINDNTIDEDAADSMSELLGSIL